VTIVGVHTLHGSAARPPRPHPASATLPRSLPAPRRCVRHLLLLPRRQWKPQRQTHSPQPHLLPLPRRQWKESQISSLAVLGRSAHSPPVAPSMEARSPNPQSSQRRWKVRHLLPRLPFLCDHPLLPRSTWKAIRRPNRAESLLADGIAASIRALRCSRARGSRPRSVVSCRGRNPSCCVRDSCPHPPTAIGNPIHTPRPIHAPPSVPHLKPPVLSLTSAPKSEPPLPAALRRPPNAHAAVLSPTPPLSPQCRRPAQLPKPHPLRCPSPHPAGDPRHGPWRTCGRCFRVRGTR
jgi:hypothetical protein